MADHDSQSLVGALLSGVRSLTVELVVSGSDRFLIVDCPSPAQAVAVQRFVTTVDPNAVVISAFTALDTATAAADPSNMAMSA